MGVPGTIRRLDRRDPAAAEIIRTWRHLTGGLSRGLDSGRRTLIACSAGRDSSALTLALAAAVARPEKVFVVAHVLHDLRPREEAEADRDAAAELAATLGLPFAHATVQARAAGGNPEGAARRLRYEQLEALAAEHDCPYVATAHHADDQLETLLMALLRGAGPDGLRGIAVMRPLPGGARRVIRPMLAVGREAAERLCRAAGWQWREDLTNADTTRLRAAVRHTIVPDLKALRPGVARRAAQSAALIGDAAAIVNERVAELWEGRQELPEGLAWERESLRREPTVVLGSLLRRAVRSVQGDAGRDRLTYRRLRPVVAAVTDRSGEARAFRLAGALVRVSGQRLLVGQEV